MHVRERQEVQEVLRPRFQLVAVSILAFWLVMMALLVRREILIPRAASQSFQASAVPTAPKNSWMGIYLSDGSQIGYIHSTSMPDVRDGEEGALLNMNVSVRTKVLGKATPIKVSGNAWASSTRGLREFDFTLRSGEHQAGVKATIDGGKVGATFEVNGEGFPIDWEADEDLFLWSGMGASNVYFPAMEEGDAFLIDAFDPVTLSNSEVLVRCVGTEALTIGDQTYTAKVVDMEYETTTTRAHIDAATGDVLRAETPLGITLQRIDPGLAVQGLLDDDASGLFGPSPVISSGVPPRNGAKTMVVQLFGLDEWVSVPLDETQQAVEGKPDTYRIVTPDVPSGELAKPVPATLPDSLKPVLEDARTAWEQVARLSEYASLQEDPLDRFMAIARDMGFEVQPIAGVEWSSSDAAFTFQVWPRVRLDQWYWVDPATGAFPADAARVQLAESADEWPRLLGQFPRMRIEVLEVE